MLDSYENRFGCALAFGVTTSYCLDVLFGSAQNVVGSRIGKVIGAAPSSINCKYDIFDNQEYLRNGRLYDEIQEA